MNKHEVARVKAAMQQFMCAAGSADRTSAGYLREWRILLERVAKVEESGRRRKARRWFQLLDSVRPSGVDGH